MLKTHELPLRSGEHVQSTGKTRAVIQKTPILCSFLQSAWKQFTELRDSALELRNNVKKPLCSAPNKSNWAEQHLGCDCISSTQDISEAEFLSRSSAARKDKGRLFHEWLHCNHSYSDRRMGQSPTDESHQRSRREAWETSESKKRFLSVCFSFIYDEGKPT